MDVSLAGAGTTAQGVLLRAFGSPDVMTLREFPMPQPGNDEVLIATEVAGVNFADTMIRRGEYLRDQQLSMAPGCEVIGRVVATGPGTERMLGRRVAAWIDTGGCYATHVVAPLRRTYELAEDVPAELAAAVFLQGITAHLALHHFGRLRAGDTVLVHAAAGGLGGLATSLAILAGAHAIGTASTAAKRNVVLALGAETVLDSRAPGTLAADVRAATGGRGCDVVVDGVGGPLFAPSIASLAVNGRYVVVGSASQQPATLDVRHLLVRNQMIVGFILGHVADAEPERPQAILSALCELVRTGALVPNVRTLPLADAAQAHRLLESRDHVGKLVLTTTPTG